MFQTPKYEQPLMREIVQLARQIRLQNMTDEKVMENIILGKIKAFKAQDRETVCSLNQVTANFQNEVFSRIMMDLSIDTTKGSPSDEDIITGYKLFLTISYRPDVMFKLWRFVNQMISSESSRTVIHTFTNLFRSGTIRDKTSFNLAKMFYYKLESTLSLEYGNILLATMTNAQKEAMIRNEWPFLKRNEEIFKNCILESNCDRVQDVFKELGMLLLQ